MNESESNWDWIDDPSADAKPTDADRLEDQLLMHGLLQSKYESKESREARVAALLERFDREQRAEPIKLPSRRRWITWSLATAAGLFVVVGTWGWIGDSSANAAIQRIVEATKQNVVRKYKITAITGRSENTSKKHFDVYTRSTDEFLAVFPDFRVQPAMIGSDGHQRWVKLGMRSWSSESETNLPLEFAIDRFTLRQLQLNALLNELPESYRARFLPPEPLPNAEGVTCRPVLCLLRRGDLPLPARMILWAHPESGIVHRIEIINPATARFQRIIADYLESIEASDDFFLANDGVQ